MDGWMGGWRHRHRRRPYLGTYEAIFSLTGCIIFRMDCNSESSDNRRLGYCDCMHRAYPTTDFLFNQCELKKEQLLPEDPARVNQPTNLKTQRVGG